MMITPSWLLQQLAPKKAAFTAIAPSQLYDDEQDKIIVRALPPEPVVKLKYIGSGDFWHGYYEIDYSRECRRVHWHPGKVLWIQKRYADAHVAESPEEWVIL
jgi:hypothetical protein